jgi:predicted nucleic acid-binding protein
LTTVVVDSSVALKWFVPEALSDQAVSLLERPIQLAAPDLLYPEAGNIVWKKVRRGELRIEEARDVIAGLERVPIAISSSSHLLEAALEIAIDHGRTVYDSLYVALAVARDCDFVTADDRLANALATGPLASYVRTLSTYVPPSA